MGDVVIERVLGEGSCGTVYLGHHADTKHLMAVKEVRKDGSARSARLLRRMDKEAKVMASVRHKYICQFLGRVDSDESRFLLMEYAKGGDLLDYINRNGPLPEKKARRIFKQLLRALHSLHQQGYVHRDVKPENVFLTEKHRVRLGDFGFATRWRPSRLLEACVGTFPYTAPEVIDQRPYVGPEVDVFSSGTVLLAMLTARIPFAAPTRKESLALLRKGHFELPATISSRARNLISGLINPDPLQRITIEDALQHSWFSRSSSRSGGATLALRQLLALSSISSSSCSSSTSSSSTASGPSLKRMRTDNGTKDVAGANSTAIKTPHPNLLTR